NVGGVRIADRFILDRAQAEALRGVVGRLLEPPVVVSQHLRLAVFEKQLAVVGAFKPASDQLLDAITVEAGAIDERGEGRVHALLRCIPEIGAMRRFCEGCNYQLKCTETAPTGSSACVRPVASASSMIGGVIEPVIMTSPAKSFSP